MRASIALAWALLTCASSALPGCSDDVVHVELPDLGESARSWVLARIDGSREVVVDAASVGSGAVRFDVPRTTLELELRAYDAPLTELGLTAGAITPALPGAAGARLPTAPRIFSARLDAEGAIGAWSSSAGQPEVAAFQRAVRDPCVQLVPTIGVLPTAARILWAVSLSPDRVLMGSEAVSAILFEAGKGPRRVPVRGHAPGDAPEPRSGFVDDSGHIWLGDHDGGLWRATFGGGQLDVERRVPPTPHGPARALDGDPSDPEAQLFTVTTSGTLAQLDGDHWRTLEVVPLEPGDDPRVHAVWLATDELITASSRWTTIRHRRPGGAVEQTDVMDSDFGVTGLTQLGPREVAAGIAAGRITHYRDGEWTALGRGGFSLDIKTFHPLPEGFLYAGVFGYTGQWLDQVGFCPVSDSPVAGSTIQHVLPMGDQLLMVGDSPRGPGNTPYTLVETRFL